MMDTIPPTDRSISVMLEWVGTGIRNATWLVGCGAVPYKWVAKTPPSAIHR